MNIEYCFHCGSLMRHKTSGFICDKCGSCKSHPVINDKQSEEQEKLWMDVCVEVFAIEKIGVAKVIKILAERYEIKTRKPLTK